MARGISLRVTTPSPSVSSRRDTRTVVHTWFDVGLVVPPSQFHSSSGVNDCAGGQGGSSASTPTPVTWAESGAPEHDVAPRSSVSLADAAVVGENFTRMI